MCGIAGFLDRAGTVRDPRAAMERMVRSIQHRGPDAQGFHLKDGIALGHARLSIIDLADGQQPMGNEDGTIWVTFNGEIFNFVELREELEARGHHFRTRSDTETILHMYEERGPACVEAFNGDFAFALWDSTRRRLLLARDRMGVRPLYYTLKDGALVFASEMKALFAFPGVAAELDPVALDQTFTFWFPLAPRTPFRGVRELPPGHLMVVQDGDISIRPYWRLQFPGRGEEEPATPEHEEALAGELHDLLVDATRLRLRADVPVGAYLSGGLDSSITTALIQRFTSSRLRTFSVAFETEEFDETAYQQEVVRALGTDHAATLCTAQAIGESFPEVIRHTERPVLRTAPAPLFQLAQLVRADGFKVVMTGEGADEILAGYDIFKEAKIRRFWARQPRSRWRPLLLRRLYPYLGGLQRQPQAYLEAFFRIGIDNPGDPFFSHLPRWSVTSRTKEFFSDEMRAALGDYDAMAEMKSALPPEYSTWHPLSQAQYLEAAYLLPGYILSSQGDRVAMAHAVEGRFPFLDHRVVELAARIPPGLRLKGLTEKHLLRRSVGGYLPPAIARRPKQPYRAPEAQSFLGDNPPPYVEELLSPSAVARAGYFDPRAVEKLVRKCRAQATVGSRENMALVGILSVQLLDHLFVQGRALDAPAPVPATSL